MEMSWRSMPRWERRWIPRRRVQVDQLNQETALPSALEETLSAGRLEIRLTPNELAFDQSAAVALRDSSGKLTFA